MKLNLKNNNFNFFFSMFSPYNRNYKANILAYLIVCGDCIINPLKAAKCDAPRPWQTSFQQPATPAMEAIIDLHHNIMLVMIFIVVFISYILLRAIWLFNSNKRNFSEIPKLSKTRHFLSLEIIWTIIPMFILFWIAVPSFALLYSMDNCPKPELTFKVIGRQWYWSYESDFFIRKPYFTPEIYERNYKFNLAIYSFVNNFLKSYINGGYYKKNSGPLPASAQELYDNFLIPSILTNYHAKANDLANNSNISFNAITLYALDYLEKNFNKDFEKIFKEFTNFNLNKSTDSTDLIFKDSLTIWDFLKNKDIDFSLKFNEYRSSIYLDIKHNKISIEDGVTNLINYLNVDDSIKTDLNRVLLLELDEDFKNNNLNEIYSNLNNFFFDDVDSGYSRILKNYFQLNRSYKFLDMLNTIKLINDKLIFDKGSNSFLTFIRFLVDENSYVFFERALNNEKISILQFFKYAINWHKDLLRISLKCSENTILAEVLKAAYAPTKTELLRKVQVYNLGVLSDYELNKIMFDHHLQKADINTSNFINKSRNLAFAVFYYINSFEDFDIKNIENVCNLFKLKFIDICYFKYILCCKYFFDKVFSDTDNVNTIISSFNTYHKIFGVMFNSHKDFAEFYNRYKHVTVDFDSCILSDNDVYKIFEELCINEDVLNLDSLSTDFCGWYRLLEVDKRLVLPIKTRIRLLITSSDVLHSWAVPSLGVKVDACPGRLNSVYVYIKRPGVFHGQCSELCGIKHGFMPIVVHGVPKNKFNTWVSSIGEFVPSSFADINRKSSF